MKPNAVPEQIQSRRFPARAGKGVESAQAECLHIMGRAASPSVKPKATTEQRRFSARQRVGLRVKRETQRVGGLCTGQKQNSIGGIRRQKCN